ncbi:sialic acid binding Ig-like lectin 15, like [Symphorus nematophorus]
MTVSPVVFVPRGEDAVLGCSFTHPRQQDYSGSITVKWLARDSRAPPFFSCSLKNNSAEEPKHCSVPGLKQSLKGDPRRGELSLLIRTVHMVDNGTYFCRVELDGVWNNYQRETQLYVTVEPQILSLSVVETNSGSDGATRSLRCEAEGHPLPTVTWLSASGSLLGGDLVRTSQVGTYRLVSSVPYAEEDVLTCRAESRLGGAETMYPDRKTLIITLTVCGLVVLLLLLSTGFIYCRRNRARAELSPAHGNTDSAPADTSPIYGNADVGKLSNLWRITASNALTVQLRAMWSFTWFTLLSV